MKINNSSILITGEPEVLEKNSKILLKVIPDKKIVILVGTNLNKIK